MAVLERELPQTTPQPAADAIPARLRRHGGSPRQVLVISLIGSVALALFGSRDLASWAERLGGGPLIEEVQGLASGWDQAMTALGLTGPHDKLRSAVIRLLDCEWDNCR